MKTIRFLLALCALFAYSQFTVSAATITGLTSTGTLVTFDPLAPGSILSTNSVTGLLSGDTLVGIDYRPIDQQLIGFGYNSNTGTARVYALSPTGAATSINSKTLNLGTGLARVMADFNPTANALRLTTSATTSNNLRLPTAGTGVLTTDTNLSPANTGIRSSAYSRNLPGGGTSGATTLYLIDGTNNALVSQGSVDFFTGSGTSPNTGTLTTIAPLSGVTGSSIVGFDILASQPAAVNPGIAYLATSDTLYNLNLTTGAATSIGPIGSGLTIVDIAAIPEPSTFVLAGFLALGFLGYASRRRLTK